MFPIARYLGWMVLAGALALPSLATAAAITSFTPTGSVKGVRQVQVRFATPMVALGDPRLPDPFAIDCPAAGTGRWADPRHWVFDFEHDLPAGLRCRFTLDARARDAAGAALQGRREFAFDTGGPAILQSQPWEGGTIDEEQVFILGLDAAVDPASVLAHATCHIDGLAESSGVSLVTGDARRTLLLANPDFLRRYAATRFGDLAARGLAAARPADEPTVRARYEALIDAPDSALVLVQCRQRLPNGAKVWLEWGAGIATASGVAIAMPQSLQFETRETFRARVHCERMNQDAGCIGALGLSVEFTAAVPRADAAKITLTDAAGHRHSAVIDEDPRAAFTWSVQFKGPLPERTRFTLEMPALHDDAGRALENQARFPLEIATDDDPPLAKFAADFGVIELKDHPALPVTVRNLEPNLRRQAPAAAAAGAPPSIGGFVRDIVGRDDRALLANPVVTTLRGRMLKIDATDPAQFGRWLTALREAQRNHYDWDEQTERYVVTARAGEKTLLADETAAQALEIPRTTHAKAFEVVGIPFAAPGLYLVELTSPRLGAALFGKPGVYHVQSLALVTNLGVHLKWGRESSVVWVTTLDGGQPVAGATVTIKDCKGATHWQGRTDRDGIAAIEVALPTYATLPQCDWNSQGLVAVAQLGADVGVVASDWNEGIENWQFNLPGPEWRNPELATTVFDRTLFRTGETVHMKHLFRRHARQGFAAASARPLAARIRHEGSDDEFPLALTFDATASSAESRWQIPADAHQGTYHVEAQWQEGWAPIGDFRVESFRVPLLRATLTSARGPAIQASALDLDVQVQYLAGGGAGGLPIKLRGLVQPREVRFDGFDDFVFMNGDVTEGLTTQSDAAWSAPQYGQANQSQLLGARDATLDDAGGAHLTLDELPRRDVAQTLTAEVEYPDPNGEILTTTTQVPLWPAGIVLGLKPDSWALSQAGVKFDVVALTLDGAPAAGVAVTVDLLQRITYSHRKRLLGGFYAYESNTEVKRLDARCSGTTDRRGRLHCEVASPVAGGVILRASATDDAGRRSVVNRDVWVGGKDDWWFGANAEDRMDVLPERRQYEPGETARLQVRMPFRTATALVTIEREGVLERFVTPLTARSPVIEVPLRGHHAPNVFVSVLVVRGRDGAVPPTALIDLGKPAYKLGFAELEVGWRAHRLEVAVTPERKVYQARDTAHVAFDVKPADGTPLAADAEIAVAAVDEGLLELRDNESWQLLAAMLGRRGVEVRTATAQLQVVGKRHFGRKAVRPGGGGGAASGTRQLFDTLLLWQARVPLDARGHAELDIPLNDSLTGFRLVAVATAGTDRFGTGMASIRATRDVMLFAGLPPMVREADRFVARLTLRNTTSEVVNLTATPTVEARAHDDAPLSMPAPAPRTVTVAAGTASELTWDVTVPRGATVLDWTFRAEDAAQPARGDALRISQQVQEAVTVRTVQASLAQLTAPVALPAAPPAGALPGRGGLRVSVQPSLANALEGVREYMTNYPYTCLEQQASRAVALQDEAAWTALVAALPTYLDGDGLARYFPGEGSGSEVLSTYVLAIAHENGWTIPEATRTRLRTALVNFIEGRLTTEPVWRTADLTLRRLAAIEALSRYPEGIDLRWLDGLDLDPALLPTSGLLDWIDLLRRIDSIPDRDQRLAQALGLLRGRLNLQGTTLTFATEREDALWWLMLNGDVNANRALLSVLEHPDWQEDIPRLVTGTLGRQREGHWHTTNANAWGVVALKKFVARFEHAPLAGTTRFAFGDTSREIAWQQPAVGVVDTLPWPAAPADFTAKHDGTGAPWLSWQARAAVPLTQPLETGYRVTRRVTPVTQRAAGTWHAGDVVRVRLEVTAQSDMTWVVVDDPIPAGATVLGSGLGKDSAILTQGDTPEPRVQATFEERTQRGYRAYYAFVPKGEWVVEYSVRLNNAGEFQLPNTRVEALYAPEMFAELPNPPVRVDP